MDNQIKVRSKIIKTFQQNPFWSFKKIAKQLKVHRDTVSKVIKRYEEDLTIARRHGSGRNKGPQDVGKARKVENLLRRVPNISGRKAARLAECSDFFVRKVKANAGMKTFKVQKVPDRNATKNSEAKKKSKKVKI